MPKSSMIAECLRSYAHWWLDRAEEADDGRNARSAIALISAAAYARELDDSTPVVARMAAAGCFATGRFDPGAEAEQIIRGWRCDDVTQGPAGLLEAVAAAAERCHAAPLGLGEQAKQAKQVKQGKQGKPGKQNPRSRSRSRRRAFRAG